MAQEVTGLGNFSTSTKHIRQLPAMEQAVVTKPRNVNSGNFTGLQYSHSLGDFDGVTINEHLDNIIGIHKLNPSTGNRGPCYER